jgi:hypothetical protein
VRHAHEAEEEDLEELDEELDRKLASLAKLQQLLGGSGLNAGGGISLQIGSSADSDRGGSSDSNGFASGFTSNNTTPTLTPKHGAVVHGGHIGAHTHLTSLQEAQEESFTTSTAMSMRVGAGAIGVDSKTSDDSDIGFEEEAGVPVDGEGPWNPPVGSDGEGAAKMVAAVGSLSSKNGPQISTSRKETTVAQSHTQGVAPSSAIPGTMLGSGSSSSKGLPTHAVQSKPPSPKAVQPPPPHPLAHSNSPFIARCTPTHADSVAARKAHKHLSRQALVQQVDESIKATLTSVSSKIPRILSVLKSFKSIFNTAFEFLSSALGYIFFVE